MVHGNFPEGYVLMWIENVTQSQVSPAPFRTTKALYLKFIYAYLFISKVYDDSYSYLKKSNKSQRITTSVDLSSIADWRKSFNSIAGRNQTLEAFCGRFIWSLRSHECLHYNIKTWLSQQERSYNIP